MCDINYIWARTSSFCRCALKYTVGIENRTLIFSLSVLRSSYQRDTRTQKYMRRITLRGTVELAWSGRWESDPRLDLGKVTYCHYTTPAR